ncbi:MAG: LysM peptidoglycan-binding domain-containing protein [Anaerolineales bacterium]
MKSSNQRTFAISILLIVGLILAACTRSANPTTLPPATGGANATAGGVAGGQQDATMAAVGTSIAAQMTGTAAVVGGATPGTGVTTQPTAVVQCTPPALQPGQALVCPSGNCPGGCGFVAATFTPSPASVVVTATPIPAAGCSNPYIVKQGDWIYQIARNCRVEPSAIIALNPGINPNRIVPGQSLNMPAPGATAVPPATPQACTGSYTVKSGDNLFRIAYNCGLTTERLASINGIAFPYTIYVGQVIRYP